MIICILWQVRVFGLHNSFQTIKQIEESRISFVPAGVTTKNNHSTSIQVHSDLEMCVCEWQNNLLVHLLAAQTHFMVLFIRWSWLKSHDKTQVWKCGRVICVWSYMVYDEEHEMQLKEKKPVNGAQTEIILSHVQNLSLLSDHAETFSFSLLRCWDTFF